MRIKEKHKLKLNRKSVHPIPPGHNIPANKSHVATFEDDTAIHAHSNRTIDTRNLQKNLNNILNLKSWREIM